MSHVLFRPHVSGATNDITTPDILVDRVRVSGSDAPYFMPTHRLVTTTDVQVRSDTLRAVPACVSVAAGGGALLTIGILLHAADETAKTGDLLLCRQAWRWRHLMQAWQDFRVEWHSGNATRTDKEPSRIGDAVGEDLSEVAEQLPRGVIAVHPIEPESSDFSAPRVWVLSFLDPHRERKLTFRRNLVSVDVDCWEDRPQGRYTVGPVGDVKHYI